MLIKSFSRSFFNIPIFSKVLTNVRTCSSSSNNDLLVGRDSNGFRTLTLNRPEKLNALNLSLYESIPNALNDYSETSPITVITGKGLFFSSGNDLMNFSAMVFNPTPQGIRDLAGKSKTLLQNYVSSYINFPGRGNFFSSGGDLSVFLPMYKSFDHIQIDFNFAKHIQKCLENYVTGFIDCEGILVGVVNGPAVGISATTLALFDVVYASSTAYFRTPFAKLGQSPEGCSSYLFPKLMGSKRANEILLLDGVLTAAEAKTVGLVTDVFPTSTFHEEVSNRLKSMSRLPPNTLKQIKKLVRDNEREKLHQVNKTECELLFDLWQSDECHQAMKNFAQRRK